MVVERCPDPGPVAGEQGPDLVERQVHLPQSADQARVLDLIRRILPIPGIWIDPDRPEQLDLAIVPERHGRQAGGDRERSDIQERFVIHDLEHHGSGRRRVKTVTARATYNPREPATYAK